MDNSKPTTMKNVRNVYEPHRRSSAKRILDRSPAKCVFSLYTRRIHSLAQTNNIILSLKTLTNVFHTHPK